MQIHPNFASLQSNGSCKLVSSSDSTFDFMQYASHHMKCCFLTSLHLLQDTTIQSYYVMPRHILVLLVLNIHDNKHNIHSFYASKETGWETVQKHNFIVNILFVSGCLTRVSTFTPASRCRSLTLRHLSYFLTSSDGVSLVINTPSCHITASQEMYERNLISIINFVHLGIYWNRLCVCGKREKNVCKEWRMKRFLEKF